MPGYLPPVGFHFRVDVLDLSNDDDIRFTEVSGLSVELGGEEVEEGGENRFVQRYPTRTKYPELVLKRGMLVSSQLLSWIRQCVEELRIEPKSVDVKLLNEQHQPLVTWHLVRAYPTRWAVSELSATNNAVVIETLQLSYQYFTVNRG